MTTDQKNDTTRPLFLFANGHEMVSAYDANDANAVYAEQVGADALESIGDFTIVDPDKLIGIWDDGEPASADCCLNWAGRCPPERTPNGHRHGCPIGHPHKKASEWAQEGRGVISSSEW